MSEKDLVPIFRGPQIEAAILKERLDEAEIPNMLRDEYERSTHSGFVAGIPGQLTILVYQQDVDRASLIVDKK